MSTTDIEPGEVMIQIEDSRKVYVGASAVEVLRADLNGQADERLRETLRAWDECDVESLDELKQVAFTLSMAAGCIDALKNLAPIELDENGLAES